MWVHSSGRQCTVHSSHENESLNAQRRRAKCQLLGGKLGAVLPGPPSGGDVIIRSYLPSLLPRIMAHLLTRAVMGGHVGHHGALMGLCHNWLAGGVTVLQPFPLLIWSPGSGSWEWWGGEEVVPVSPVRGWDSVMVVSVVDSIIVSTTRSGLACTAATVPHKLPRLFSLLDLGAGHYPCNTPSSTHTTGANNHPHTSL